MTFASDKLYKGYLRRNMPTIVSKVKVREIVPHLPCLTDHDRENIEAKRETYGNFDSMVLLLDCLKRRENWPEEFITALEECNHSTIAAEIRNEYNALKGNSNPGSPPASVTRAHVHPAPSAIHLPTPESSGNSDAATALPGETSAPPQAAVQAPPPQEVPQQPQPPETSALPACPPPQPVTQPQLEVRPVPSTPPPSPEAQPSPAASRSAPPLTEAPSHQEPVENSEADDSAVIPEHLSTVEAPQPPSPVEQSETDAQPEGGDVRSTTPTAEVMPPPSPPAAPVNSDITYGSTLSVKTPEKAPVQDSNPPILPDEETPVPACTQDAERRSPTGAAPLPAAAAVEDDSLAEDTLCLSQPGQLISIQPQLPASPPLPAPISPVEPYSGNTTRLEMSSVAEDLAPTAGSSAVTSATVATSSMLPCQENGIVVNHNQPEENHYDSPIESLEMQEIRENLLRIREEPSILNQDGHDSTPRGQRTHDEAATEMISGAAAAAEPANTPPESGGKQPPEPAPVESPSPAPQDSEKTSSRLLTSHTKYFVTAAGVGACALLLAWKFKN